MRNSDNIRDEGVPRWLAYMAAFGALLLAGLTLAMGCVAHLEFGYPRPSWWMPVLTGGVGAILPVAAVWVGWGVRELAKSHKWTARLIVALIAVVSWCGFARVTVAPFITSGFLKVCVYGGGSVLLLLITAANHKIGREYRADPGGWNVPDESAAGEPEKDKSS